MEKVFYISNPRTLGMDRILQPSKDLLFDIFWLHVGNINLSFLGKVWIQNDSVLHFGETCYNKTSEHLLEAGGIPKMHRPPKNCNCTSLSHSQVHDRSFGQALLRGMQWPGLTLFHRRVRLKASSTQHTNHEESTHKKR